MASSNPRPQRGPPPSSSIVPGTPPGEAFISGLKVLSKPGSVSVAGERTRGTLGEFDLIDDILQRLKRSCDSFSSSVVNLCRRVDKNKDPNRSPFATMVMKVISTNKVIMFTMVGLLDLIQSIKAETVHLPTIKSKAKLAKNNTIITQEYLKFKRSVAWSCRDLSLDVNRKNTFASKVKADCDTLKSSVCSLLASCYFGTPEPVILIEQPPIEDTQVKNTFFLETIAAIWTTLNEINSTAGWENCFSRTRTIKQLGIIDLWKVSTTQSRLSKRNRTKQDWEADYVNNVEFLCKDFEQWANYVSGQTPGSDPRFLQAVTQASDTLQAALMGLMENYTAKLNISVKMLPNYIAS